MQDAFEAQYGDKIRCRMIMVDKQTTGMEIWEELKKNPGAFEKLAQERSVDSGSRSLGGLLGQPITRHAFPQHLSDSAFRVLVDGDPRDRDPSHKPKDGDFTGLIQVSESAWVILRREELLPGGKNIDPKDERVRKQLYEMIYEVKLKEAMGFVFQELMRAAAVENKLTGSIKLANEEHSPDYRVDGNVKLMSNPQNGKPASPGAGAQAAPAARRRCPAQTAAAGGSLARGGPAVRVSPATARIELGGSQPNGLWTRPLRTAGTSDGGCVVVFGEDCRFSRSERRH